MDTVHKEVEGRYSLDGGTFSRQISSTGSLEWSSASLELALLRSFLKKSKYMDTLSTRESSSISRIVFMQANEVRLRIDVTSKYLFINTCFLIDHGSFNSMPASLYSLCELVYLGSEHAAIPHGLSIQRRD
jgi:hypothetical protein